MTNVSTSSLLDILQNVFGYDSFRMEQEAIIRRTLEGESSLIIMPTGGGKSLCYQIPAMIYPGLTIVVSPLIALMKDQVDALFQLGVPAAAPNSTTDSYELQAISDSITEGTIKLLYLSPEKAVSAKFMSFIARQNISLIAIDEAHCVSIWGNDFRPEYSQLRRLLEIFPAVPVLALTATADKATRSDIVNQLGITGAKTFVSSFERANLYMEVLPASDRVRQIHRFLQIRPNQPGIIYCLSRKGTEGLAAKLTTMGYRAACYHAKLPPATRDKVQQDFLNDELQIVCATIAFGMGIDKSNIRWVIHYSLPKNVESYYQEIGRAGRDGQPAHALMFGGFGDVMTYRKMFESGHSDPGFQKVQMAKLNRIWEFVQASNCRTNFILNYFSEHRTATCDHCDNCQYPREQLDGTVVAQKAISALLRTQEQVGIGMLADILRGSRRSDILRAGYDRIRTFGAGKNHSRFIWLQYITQLIDRGFMEIDYTKDSRLRVTALGQSVVRNEQNVLLTAPKEWDEKKSKAKRVTKTSLFQAELRKTLKSKRRTIADNIGINPCHVFTDATLEALTSENPLFRSSFEQVSGVTKQKWERYGSDFLSAIRTYNLNQKHLRQVKGLSLIETLSLRDQGHPVVDIAKQRDLRNMTIYSHLADLFTAGEDIQIGGLVSQKELGQVREAWLKCGQKADVNIIAEHMLRPMALGKIKLCQAVLVKENG